MPPLATGPLRLLRASVGAVVTVALAGLAHVLGGGGLPAPMVLGALSALVLVGATALTGRRVGPLAVVAALGAAQVGLHQAFGLVSAMGCAAPGASGAGAHTHHAATHLVLSCAPHIHAGAGGVSMLALHAAATLATALLLAGAERSVWWVLALLRPLVAAAEPVRILVWRALPVWPAIIVLARQAWRGATALRGPPGAVVPALPVR